jgi:hypothetical protein
MLWGGRRDCSTIVAIQHRPTESPMSLPFDAGRSLAPLDQDRTLIVVVGYEPVKLAGLGNSSVCRAPPSEKKRPKFSPARQAIISAPAITTACPIPRKAKPARTRARPFTAHMDAAADVCRENRVEAKKSCAALGNSSDTALGIYECSFGIMHSIYDINT